MAIDWRGMFVPEASVLEVMIRGTFMYLGLFAILRVLVRRHVGSMSLMDLLLMVVIADAAQNAMAGEYKSITEGAVLCGTIIGWNYFMDWLAFRFPPIRKLLDPPPLELVRDGVILRKNLRQELITEDEVRSQLREHGIEDLSVVRVASLEPGGSISVFRKDGNDEEDGEVSAGQGALR